MSKSNHFLRKVAGSAALMCCIVQYADAEPGFRDYVNIRPVDARNSSLFAGDFNNDGMTDFIGDVSGDLNLSINNGGLDFTDAKFDLEGDFLSLVTGDFNSDGLLDFAGGSAESVYLNNGSTPVAFTRHQLVPPVSGSYNFAAADLDQDGDLDLIAVFKSGIEEIQFWINVDGSGTQWSSMTLPSLPRNSGEVHAADLNGDDKPDFVTVGDDHRPKLYINDGDGSVSFAAPTELLDSSRYLKLSLGDIDNDGDVDIAAGSDFSTTVSDVSILRNDGTATFESEVVSLFNPVVIGIQIADINQDGKGDVVVASNDAKIAWYENPGWGEHSLTSNETQVRSSGFHAGDMTGDGSIDIIVSGFDTTVSPLHSTTGVFEQIDGIAAKGIEYLDDNDDGILQAGEPGIAQLTLANYSSESRSGMVTLSTPFLEVFETQLPFGPLEPSDQVVVDFQFRAVTEPSLCNQIYSPTVGVSTEIEVTDQKMSSIVFGGARDLEYLVSIPTSRPIPDNDPIGIVESLVVDVLPSQTVGIPFVQWEVSHPYLDDLQIYVTPPNSPEELIADSMQGYIVVDGMARVKSAENIDPNGIWKIRFVDTHEFDAGNLRGWGLSFDYQGDSCTEYDLQVTPTPTPTPTGPSSDPAAVFADLSATQWEQSGGSATLTPPTYTTDGGLGMAINDATSTFGFWQTRSTLDALPAGLYEIQFDVEGDTGAAIDFAEFRPRVFNEDPRFTSMIASSSFSASSSTRVSLYWKSDGTTPWRVALDALSFESTRGGNIRITSIKYTKIN